MARISNQEHVARTLRALSILRSEPGWHPITRLAEIVGAKPTRLNADLRRCCYAADDWNLPLMFGSDMEPEHSDGDAVVQVAPDVPLTLLLPTSRVEILRLALMAGAAARHEPNHPSAPTLRALDARLTAILDSQSIEVGDREPEAAATIRSAITRQRQITFMYRAMTDTEAGRRSATPIRIERRGKWWLFDAIPSGESDVSTYRVDRVIGNVDDAGEGDSAESPDEPDPKPIASTAIRLELHEDELWAVDDFSPTELEYLDDERVGVTIHVFAPVPERLSRLLFLTNPVTTNVVAGREHLTSHVERLKGLQHRPNSPGS